MWVVMIPQRWDSFDQSHASVAGIPIEIKIDQGRMSYFLPVYDTLEDAQADFPEGPIKPIQFIEVE